MPDITYDEMIAAIKDAIDNTEAKIKWQGGDLGDIENDSGIEALKATIAVLENLKKLEK